MTRFAPVFVALWLVLSGCPESRKVLTTCVADSECSGGFLCVNDECLDPDGDLDADGVTNGDERLHGLDPADPDSDGDGLIDGAEYGSLADPRDSDEDGIPDALEHAALDIDCDGLADQVDPSITEDACDDGDPCTVDTCDSGSGQCSNVVEPINAAELCNGEDDDCDGQVDEDFAVGSTCELDGQPCLNGINRCAADGLGLSCETGAPKAEGAPCTPGSCNGLQWTAAGTCNAANECEAAASAVDCDDADPCTTDTCSPDGGCTNEPGLCADPGPEVAEAVEVVEMVEADASDAGATDANVDADAGTTEGVIADGGQGDVTVDSAGPDLPLLDAAPDAPVDVAPEVPPTPLSAPQTTPLDGRLGVGTATAVAVVFDLPVEAGSVIAQNASGPCTGSIQLSDDDFSSCLGLTVGTVSDTEYTVTPLSPLATLTFHRVRVTTAVTPLDGAPGLVQDYQHVTGFRTGVTPNDAKLLWSTTQFYTGNMGGYAGADANCSTTDNLPVGVTSAKAFLGGPGRYPCDSANCSPTSNAQDWVLLPNTPYVRGDGNSIGTTTASAIFTFPLSDELNGAGWNFWWGLLDDWTTDGTLTCSDWSSSTGSARVGWDQATGSGAISGGQVVCSSDIRLMCAEQ